MKYLIYAIILFLASMAFPTHADEKHVKPNCKGGICIAGRGIHLTDDDINILNEILSKDEMPNLKYQVVTIKNIITGFVYLLSASKPDYYGIQIVLAKEGGKWLVLKKIKSIY